MTMILGQLVKASLIATDVGVTPVLPFTYNPAEISTSKSATWSRPQARGATSATQPQFQGSNPQTVTMEIWFDAWDDPTTSVTLKVRTLLEWTRPTLLSIARGTPRPPMLKFEWGVSLFLAEFKGYLKQVQAKYVLFDADGTPTRASANITLEEVPDDPPGQNPTSGSRESRRSHLMDEGDSLASVAYREYGDPNLWRGLAAFNGIDDPLRIQPGSRVLIPTAAEARSLAAREP